MLEGGTALRLRFGGPMCRAAAAGLKTIFSFSTGRSAAGQVLDAVIQGKTLPRNFAFTRKHASCCWQRPQCRIRASHWSRLFFLQLNTRFIKTFNLLPLAGAPRSRR